MSYIHRFIEDKETPGPIKSLYLNFVRDFNNQNSKAWNKQIKLNSEKYHRKVILKQGRCDFDAPQYGLTSHEMIVLYNYYYFPMHFQSSYEIFNMLFKKHLDLDNKSLFFHDYGCGTLSSAMSFGAVFQEFQSTKIKQKINEPVVSGIVHNGFKYNKIDLSNHLHFYTDETFGNINSYELGEIRNAGTIEHFNLPSSINGYYFYDSSIAIKKFLKDYLKQNLYIEPNQNYFFNVAYCTDSYYEFENIADKIYLGSFNSNTLLPFWSFCNSQHIITKDVTVILNFSYVLASDSIDIGSINLIINEYLKTGCKLIIVNQNPDLDSLNNKWDILKQNINYIECIQGLQPIKHFGAKSKSRFEILFPVKIEDMFNNLIDSFNNNDFDYIENKLKKYFKSNSYKPLWHELYIDKLSKNGYFNFCNFVTDFQFSHGYVSVSGYYHNKAHLYRDISSIDIARCFYEKENFESDGKMTICYKEFMTKNFPNISL